MNPINKTALKLTGTTEKDFLDYCNQTKRRKTSNKSRQIYFNKILNDQIVKDSKTGSIKILKEK